MRQVILDTETTGLEPEQGHRIIEVGCIEVDQREIVETRMKAAGVPTAVHYPIALHEQPVFEGLGHALGAFPVSEAAARRVISLPMHPYLAEEQQRRVVAALKEGVRG